MISSFFQRISELPWPLLAWLALFFLFSLTMLFAPRFWRDLHLNYWSSDWSRIPLRIVGIAILAGIAILLGTAFYTAVPAGDLSAAKPMNMDMPLPFALVFLTFTALIGAILTFIPDAIRGHFISVLESGLFLPATRLGGLVFSIVTGGLIYFFIFA